MIATTELSKAAVVDQLRALDVKRGGVLLVHTSFRAVAATSATTRVRA